MEVSRNRINLEMTKVLGELWSMMLAREVRPDLLDSLESAIINYAKHEWIDDSTTVEFHREKRYFIVRRPGRVETCVFGGLK